ncbi:MAG TPA: hypothetical protein DEE98_01195 [Elusimicrobia bacterium]|nr:MAG: hypothetical protein A2278_03890 [Elusimicrobia bacterium RIFOXYA12_FULL_49_49]OGS10073.1 MAG: hypothetical protein A2204_07910 [Elusimicrobia bacterium RIFOXYA1_FULL_47_7]OGS15301.1 MAG: hypothetical protein A2251_07205 [Elusimicrobia bacterium RIFOXYA2_FULL_47_53]OGS26545.1 MAG: hypothetical protein A2339_06915 [Elusimicrobia bacterium RIFOXYB12_FULL_50_12]OGS30556.1 MAG: hypothetical protein A2323_02325 [Elusimicrobia bacterium RIFOXYB2_FULL_46_23]HBU68978.1 hypothetical protein [El
MNRNDLIESLLKVLSTKKEARDAVEGVFSLLAKSLSQGEKVVISGFGTFTPYISRAKKARNPKTGQTVHISPRKKVRFKQSKELF